MQKRIITRDLVTYFGISLTIIGVPLGMYFNFMFPSVMWSNLFMLISVLCITSYKNLKLFLFPSSNVFFKLIIIFQLLMLCYGIFSSRMDIRYATFHLYVIALSIALSTLDIRYYFRSEVLVFVIFIVSALCSLLGAYFIYKGLVVGNEAWQLRQDNESYSILEVFTIANGALVNFISLLSLRYKNKYFVFVGILFLFLDLYIFFQSTKRTPVFVVFVVFILFLYMKNFFTVERLALLVKLFVAVIGLSIFLYITVDPIRESVDIFWLNFTRGVSVLFGDTNISSPSDSAMSRVLNRQWTYDYINNEFGIYNYLFGAGYMKRWIDNPILEAFLDMGFVGFIFFTFLIIVFPLRMAYKFKGTNNQFLILSVLICIYSIASVINSGNPYLYTKHIPITILAFAYGLKINYDKIDLKKIFLCVKELH